ncbi:unnamed protein product [Pleuronectes platessa]|uniref:Uncharacterized protein n=1 Tax=Pleuronectes platessa TaxID=8262 RepID=A0A9N7W3C3_PLEPL|nr:unnamed protein product [Pleuronectes platessa]
MQMGQTGDRTADLQVGGQPLYLSATAALYLRGFSTAELNPQVDRIGFLGARREQQADWQSGVNELGCNV